MFAQCWTGYRDVQELITSANILITPTVISEARYLRPEMATARFLLEKHMSITYSHGATILMPPYHGTESM
jgi:hypothetical protein